MNFPLRLTTLAVALLVPSIALAGGDRRGSRADFEFIAVVDSLDLPNDLVDSLDLLDYDGPVIVAAVTSGGRADSLAIRYEADFDDLDTLAVFEELLLLDPVLRENGMPVVMTDLLSPVVLADFVGDGIDPSSMRSVIDASFLDAEAEALFPAEFDGADVIVALDGGNSVQTVRLDELPGMRFVEPSEIQTGLLNAAAPVTDADSWMGLLCEGPETADAVCTVASAATSSDSGAGYSLYVEWTFGGPSVRYPSEPEEDTEVTEPEPEGETTDPEPEGDLTDPKPEPEPEPEPEGDSTSPDSDSGSAPASNGGGR